MRAHARLSSGVQLSCPLSWTRSPAAAQLSVELSRAVAPEERSHGQGLAGMDRRLVEGLVWRFKQLSGSLAAA